MKVFVHFQCKSFSIIKEQPGVISEKAAWVFLTRAYLYESESFIGLLRKVVKEWKSDKHLI